MQYRREFIDTYDALLADWPDEYDSFYYLSEDMREHFMKVRRRIPILHRNGGCYLLSPKSERLERVDSQELRNSGHTRLSLYFNKLGYKDLLGQIILCLS